MAGNWWYSLVAEKLVKENAEQKLKIERLEADVVSLSRPSPVKEWVEGAQVAAAKQRNRELEAEIAKMGLLRDALRNEKAYTLFLEDSLECKNPCEVFNALPLETRKQYFDRVK